MPNAIHHKFVTHQSMELRIHDIHLHFIFVAGVFFCMSTLSYMRAAGSGRLFFSQQAWMQSIAYKASHIVFYLPFAEAAMKQGFSKSLVFET